MPRVVPFDLVEYPESDGMPMGETDLHQDWMIRLLDIFRHRYRDQRVYVASDLLLYYQEGDPKKVVVPDLFVVKDCKPGRRRTFRVWEEGKAPNMVVEVTSRSSRKKDQEDKPRIYSGLGIAEYFLYDPTGDYLSPRLQGFRLEGGDYCPIEGELSCRELDVILQLDGDDLVLRDSGTGEVLLTRAETSEQAGARALESQTAAEARAAALEEEVRQLRSELKRLR